LIPTLSGPFTVIVCVEVPEHPVEAVSISFNEAVVVLFQVMLTVFPDCEAMFPPTGTQT
jgi:hypothetical protein